MRSVIDVILVNYPGRILFGFGGILQRRQFALAIFATFSYPTQFCIGIYTSDGIPSEANGWTGLNWSGYRSPDMDRACYAAYRELDEAARKRLLHESARLVARDLPVIPLYFRVSTVAAKAGLQNYKILTTGGAGSDTWNAHTWYWK